MRKSAEKIDSIYRGADRAFESNESSHALSYGHSKWTLEAAESLHSPPASVYSVGSYVILSGLWRYSSPFHSPVASVFSVLS